MEEKELSIHMIYRFPVQEYWSELVDLEEGETCFDDWLVLELDLLLCEKPCAIGAGFLFVYVSVLDEPLVVDEVDAALHATQWSVVEAHLALLGAADHQGR